jgi:hypothetical protein
MSEAQTDLNAAAADVALPPAPSEAADSLSGEESDCEVVGAAAEAEAKEATFTKGGKRGGRGRGRGHTLRRMRNTYATHVWLRSCHLTSTSQGMKQNMRFRCDQISDRLRDAV